MRYITEEEVRRNLHMPDVISAVRSAFESYSRGDAAFSPRDRLFSDGIVFNTMPAILGSEHIAGMKAYIAGRHGANFIVMVFDTASYELKAVVEANRLGQMRTGALPAIATSMLLEKKDIDFALIGTGYQAETQLEAMNELFNLRAVRVFSRNMKHVEDFSATYSERFSLDIKGVSSARECVSGADVITTITNSKEPLFSADWLGDSFHINLVGGNLPDRREVGNDVLSKADLVVVEDLKQSLIESGEIIGFYDNGSSKIIEFSSMFSDPGLFSGKKKTVFKTMGVGLEDIAVANLLL